MPLDYEYKFDTVLGIDPITHVNNDWYSTHQTWTNGINNDSRFRNAQELSWHDHGHGHIDITNHQNRWYVELSAFYILIKDTNLYALYNLFEQGGSDYLLMNKNEKIRGLTLIYPGATDQLHSIMTKNMVDHNGYILKIVTDVGNIYHVGLVGTEDTDKKVFVKLKNSTTVYFVRPFDLHPHPHPTVIAGHHHNPAVHCPSFNTMVTDVDNLGTGPGYFETVYLPDCSDQICPVVPHKSELDDARIIAFSDFHNNFEDIGDWIDVAGIYMLRFQEVGTGTVKTITSTYYRIDGKFHSPNNTATEYTIKSMKLFRPYFGSIYYNDLNNDTKYEGGFVLQIEYEDTTNLPKMQIFQLYVSKEYLFYLSKIVYDKNGTRMGHIWLAIQNIYNANVLNEIPLDWWANTENKPITIPYFKTCWVGAAIPVELQTKMANAVDLSKSQLTTGVANLADGEKKLLDIKKVYLMVTHNGTVTVCEIADEIYPDKKRKQDKLAANTVNAMKLEHPTIIWVPPTDGSNTEPNLPNYYRMSEIVFKKHGWVLVVNSTHPKTLGTSAYDQETLIQFWTTNDFQVYVQLVLPEDDTGFEYKQRLYKVKNTNELL